MKRQATKAKFLLTSILSCWLAASAYGVVEAEASPAPTTPPPTTPAPVAAASAKQEFPTSDDVLRAYLQLQEQIRAAQLSIEHNRQESEAAAIRYAETLSNRLATIEATMNAQREREMESMRSANQTMLIAVGIFALLGFSGMLFAAWLQWRSASRLSEMAASSYMTKSLLPSGWVTPVSEGESRLAGELPGSANSRLLDTVGHLEKLVLSLENTARPPLTDTNGGEHASNGGTSNGAEGSEHSNGNGNGNGISNGNPDDASLDTAARITMLLGKGQSLLSLDQTEEAIVCFDEVLALDEKNTDALVKKGVALERQRKLPEAIECYDLAIAADSSITIAYLYKGGICNRLERFNEALECYEKALRTQEKRRVAA